MFSAVDSCVLRLWRGRVLEELKDFVRLPSKSPAFDADWEKNGFLLEACNKAAAFGKKLFPEGRFEVLSKPAVSPVLFFELTSQSGAKDEPCALFYGHFDKQPEGPGWSEGHKPFEPVIENNRLYGRGAVDDGYAFYAALTAVKALDEAGVSRPRVCGIIECSEECGSPDFPAWLDELGTRVGKVAMICVLDGCCDDYGRLWCTTSFRGNVSATLSASLLSYGVHSGAASGIVPESFSVIRMLLDRFENAATGAIEDKAFRMQVCDKYIERVRHSACVLGETVLKSFPWLEGAHPGTDDVAELLLKRAFTPQLAIIGASGLPSVENAGNVLRAGTSVRLSVRTPPAVDVDKAFASLKQTLTDNPPFGAQVTVSDPSLAEGWIDDNEQPWFAQALQSASREIFGEDAAYRFDGATIGILGMMGKTFPQAQFFVTGCLGPGANAHGPDEMIDLAYLEKLTQCVARVTAAVPHNK